VKVWIVAKIYGSEHPRIHGLTEENQNVRLLPKNASSEPLPFEVGQIWDLSFSFPKLFLPHVENRIVDSWKFMGKETDLRSVILARKKPWEGSLRQLFDSSLLFDVRGKGMYLEEGSRSHRSLAKSIGYWLPKTPLIKIKEKPFISYSYDDCLVDYSGFGGSLPEISAQTLVQVSLKPWWMPSPDFAYYNEYKQRDETIGKNIAKRSYLEICAWYL
jgi:hypothetical protein